MEEKKALSLAKRSAALSQLLLHRAQHAAQLHKLERVAQLFSSVQDRQQAFNTALQLQRQTQQRRLSMQAADLAQQLQEGQPCPVCGAVHHPSPAAMQTPGVTDEQIEQLTAQAQRAYGELSSQQALLEELLSQLRDLFDAPPSPEQIAGQKQQTELAIHQLEEPTGKKFDEKKFELACKHANRTAQNWLKVCDFLQYKPAPMSGFDLFNHMADVVTARGKEAAADAFELLSKDLQKNIEEGTSTLPFPEQYRVMFGGIPCWPKLPSLFKPLKEHGVNVTAVVYAPAFGFVYNNMDEMVRAYCKAPNSVCIEQGVDWREGICRDNKVDGVLVHYNRSCKPWSGYMAEMQRRFTKDLGVPCAGLDGDQADPRNFNEAQYETRVQGLVEAMEANQAKKEAEAK